MSTDVLLFGYLCDESPPSAVQAFVENVMEKKWHLPREYCRAIAQRFYDTPGGGFMDLELEDLMIAMYNMQRRHARSILKAAAKMQKLNSEMEKLIPPQIMNAQWNMQLDAQWKKRG